MNASKNLIGILKNRETYLMLPSLLSIQLGPGYSWVVTQDCIGPYRTITDHICHQFIQYFILYQLWIVDLNYVQNDSIHSRSKIYGKSWMEWPPPPITGKYRGSWVSIYLNKFKTGLAVTSVSIYLIFHKLFSLGSFFVIKLQVT